MRWSIVLLAYVSACGKSDPPHVSGDQSSARQQLRSAANDKSTVPVPTKTTAAAAQDHTFTTCTKQPFAGTIDLPEASGATFLDSGELLVVGDSGTNGSYVVMDQATGKTQRHGNLPLDANSSDDLEGLSQMNGRLFAITSSGWMREWSQQGDQFILKTPSYPVAPFDKRALVCQDGKNSNCAQNYEGLCLLKATPPNGQCAGFAASKANGHLLCLTYQSSGGNQGQLVLDPSRQLEVASPNTLTGCYFDENQRLWFGTNLFAANIIGYVENWQIPENARISRLGPVGIGFQEAIAVGASGTVYRFSDTSGSPSLIGKYICR